MKILMTIYNKIFGKKSKKKTYITADLHLFHTGILKHTARKYKNFNDMNQHIVKVWNSVVKPEDDVIIAGDIAFTNKRPTKKRIDEILLLWHKLNGNKIVVKGNHEGEEFISKLKEIGTQIENRLFISIKDKSIEIVHDPKHALGQVNNYDYILHGHLHGNKSYETTTNPNIKYIDIGWDVFKRPIEIKKIIK